MIAGYVIAALFYACAAIFSAVMDVGNFHPHRMHRHPFWQHHWRKKYNNGNPANGRVVWFGIGRMKIIKPVQLIDGWHLSKMLMVICHASALLAVIQPPLWGYAVGYAAAYLLWNIPFNLFYHKVL